jgi:tellurite methyltransferase
MEFFDSQFQRQVSSGEYVLNPFEQAILPFVSGTVLDLACGLGNLSIEAGRKGCSVLALDASPTAIADLKRRSAAEGLSIEACVADLREVSVQGQFDSVIAIGLLMFLPMETARTNLDCIKSLTKAGGIAAINTLIEGTTYLDMFEPKSYCLFAENELPASFANWKLEYAKIETFPAPRETVKRFCTVVARNADSTLS